MPAVSPRARREAVIVLLLFVAAFWWGQRYVTEWRAAGQRQVFYQEYFEPAAMIACGYGFVHAVPSYEPPMGDFIRQRVDRFDCASISPGQPVSHTGMPQQAWFYLMWTVGLYWMLFGVSWSGLVWFLGFLFALVVVIAYATFRLAAPMWLAAPAAVALMMSVLHRQNLPHLRDYAKAPFVLGLLLILFWMVRRRSTATRLIALSALYGVVLGFGYGFRADFLSNIPPLIITVLCFVPGFSLRDLAGKAAALVVAAALFVAVSWPAVSYVVQQGGCQWHVVMLGLEHNFDDNLGVTPSYYQWVARFSDEYIHTSVNSYLYRTGALPPVPYCSIDYDVASGGYLVSILQTAPGDVLTRAYTSTLRVMDLPFYLFGTGPETTLNRSPLGEFLTNFVGTGRLAVFITVVILGAASWQWGLFAVFVVMYFGSYPSLQFASRHFFHLEFLGWWAIAFVVAQMIRTALWLATGAEPAWATGDGKMVRRGLLFAAVVAAVIWLPLPLARAYQDATIATLTQDLLAAPRVPVALSPEAGGAGLVLTSPPLLEGSPDLTQTALLDVTLDLAACPSGVPLGVLYDKANPFYDFSASIAMQPAGRPAERILVPVYRGFLGLSLGGAPASCVTRVERLESVRGLPLLPVLTLPPGWRDLPRHQSIGKVALRLWGYGD